MRQLTIKFQGMKFTFIVAARATKTSQRGNVSEWKKVKVIREGETVDYIYAKGSADMRLVAMRWLKGAS